jgi:polyisoprenoid-binding protein YceI
MLKFALLALALFAFPLNAQAASAQKWTVDPEASSIQFSGKHAGNEFTGSFKTWTAAISFDPENLEASVVDVTIDMGSASTGNKTYDGSLPSAEWLDSGAFPTATFAGTTFRQTGDTTYEVDGVLKIKGIEIPLTFPFTLDIKDDIAELDAHLTLDRIALNVGKKADSNGEWVTKDIGVTLTVKASKAK